MVGVCLKIVINIISIDKIYVEVLCTDNALCYEGVTFEEAGEMEWYDASAILAQEMRTMGKICVGLYGGKSIFKGKEIPLQGDTIYCECPDKCSLYKEGKCLCIRRLGIKCPNGTVTTEKGYTSRAKKYGAFRQKYISDETYARLKKPLYNRFAVVGDNYWFSTGYVRARKAKEDDSPREVVSGYVLWSNIGTSEFCIPIVDMNIQLLNAILSYSPRNIFGESLEKYYLEYVADILKEMQEIVPERYQELTEKYPEYKSEKYIPNYVGKYAYIRTLRDGCTVCDSYGNVGILKDGKIYCDNFKGIVPFGGESASVVIKLRENSTIKITDNSQVCERTIFK